MSKQSVALMNDEDFRRNDDADREAGFGALSTEAGQLPLRALQARADIVGLLYTLTVRQTFCNAYDRALEATYIFPLPDRAAVSRFRLKIANRIVEGQLKERSAARLEYDRAIEEGHRAAIAEEDRPGVFTMRVGNIAPGESAQVELLLQGPLSFVDDEASFRFPLVVAPRYIPGVPLPGDSVGDGVELDTDAVPDASRISPPILLPGFKSPVRLDLKVSMDPAGLQFSNVRSSLHTVTMDEDAAGRLTLRVAPGERLDRDFILRWKLAEDSVATSLVLHPDGKDNTTEGTFALTLVPPQERAGTRRARDVVFVLDRSGSMGGWKMVAARRAMARMVDTLTAKDRFQIFAFDNSIESLPGQAATKLHAANDRNRFSASEFLSSIDARGGTEMAQPLEKSVALLSNTDGERDRVLILCTDGQVGNEQQIVRSIGDRLRSIRVFTLGIDRSVNEAFLQQLSKLGGGSSEIVESEDRLDAVMDRIHRLIGTPVLTNLELKEKGMSLVADTITPRRLPDLFSGSPVIIFGRYKGFRGDSFANIEVRARAAHNEPQQFTVEPMTRDNAAVARVWARGHLRDLEDQLTIAGGNPDLKARIIKTSLRFTVLCRYTAFVAVDREERIDRDDGMHKVNQPVESPAGWEQELGSVKAKRDSEDQGQARSILLGLSSLEPLEAKEIRRNPYAAQQAMVSANLAAFYTAGGALPEAARSKSRASSPLRIAMFLIVLLLLSLIAALIYFWMQPSAKPAGGADPQLQSGRK